MTSRMTSRCPDEIFTEPLHLQLACPSNTDFLAASEKEPRKPDLYSVSARSGGARDSRL